MSAGARIEQYLVDHPSGDLLIAVAYATPAGMAWLARRTTGRRVSLLIGDTRPQYWTKVKASDRDACLAFMGRNDVEIRNWYRTKKSRSGESSAHLKVWAVHQDWSPVAALVGSGNLTRKGLDDNVEVMAEAHNRDMRQAWDTARDLWEKAWTCADRLREYLGAPESPDGSAGDQTWGAAGRSTVRTFRRTSRSDPTIRSSLPPPPPRSHATASHTRSGVRTGSTKWRRRKRVTLYVISGLFAWLGATALLGVTADGGTQNGDITAVIWMLLIASLFFLWARRHKN